MAKASLNVTIPPGMKAGQEIQAVSPDGTVVQATIPKGMKPGQTFQVQYTPVAPSAPSSGNGSGSGAGTRLCEMYSGGDLMILAALVVVGFALPVLLKNGGGLLNFLSTYVVPIVCAGLAIAYDWDTKGPTVALKSTLAAAAIAWLIVVPLGVVTHSLLHYFTSVLLVASCLALCFAALVSFGVAGGFLAFLIMILFVMFGGVLTWLISGPLGTAVAFMGAFFCMRVFFSLLSRGPLHPATWPDVNVVKPESEEYRTQSDSFLSSCEPWAHKYDFDLRIKKIYRIDRAAPNQSQAPSAERGRQLFHGTPWEAAMGIVCDGFRLPQHPGMFGRGIYFADCPLKSWRYCFQSKSMAETLPRLTGTGGYILMCWVDLGKTRQEKEAKPELKGYNRSSWMNWFTGHRHAYDSVQGLTEEDGGALRVPEYIVYDPKQVRLAYLFEVEKLDRGQPVA